MSYSTLHPAMHRLCTCYSPLAAHASSLRAGVCLHAQALAQELIGTVPYRHAWYHLHACGPGQISMLWQRPAFGTIQTKGSPILGKLCAHGQEQRAMLSCQAGTAAAHLVVLWEDPCIEASQPAGGQDTPRHIHVAPIPAHAGAVSTQPHFGACVTTHSYSCVLAGSLQGSSLGGMLRHETVRPACARRPAPPAACAAG